MDQPIPGYDEQRVAARLVDAGLDPDRLRFFAAGCAERAAPTLTCRRVLRRDPAAAELVYASLPLLWTTPPPRLAEARDLLAELRVAHPAPSVVSEAEFDPAEALLVVAVALASAVVVAAFECYLTPTPERAAATGGAAYRQRAEVARLAHLPVPADRPPPFASDELDCQRADIGALSTVAAPRRAAQQVAGPAQRAGAVAAATLMEILANIEAATEG